MLIESPIHNEVSLEVVIVGNASIVICTESMLAHPFVSVPVT